MDEVETIHQKISPQVLPTNLRFSSEELLQRLKTYDAIVEVLQAMVITGAYWGNTQMGELITKSLEQLSDSLSSQSVYQPWFDLELYPALVLMYSAGLASLAKTNYETLAACLIRPQNRYTDQGAKPLILTLCPDRVMDTNTGRLLPGRERQFFPLREYLFEVLAMPLKEYLSDSRQFDKTFDRFEFLLSMVFADEDLQQQTKTGWIPVGRFAYKAVRGYSFSIVQVLSQEIEKTGGDWPLLKTGFFGGSIERARKALDEVITFLKNRANYLMG